MANKRMVPGSSASKGLQSGIPVYDEGTYQVEIKSVAIDETRAGTGEMLKLRGKILEGPRQADGTDVKGAAWFHSIFMPFEEHPSYESMKEMVADRIKGLCDAAGVKIPKSDNVDFDQLEGKAIEVDMTVSLREDRRTGEQVPQNEVRAYREA